MLVCLRRLELCALQGHERSGSRQRTQAALPMRSFASHTGQCQKGQLPATRTGFASALKVCPQARGHSKQ
eukprot:13640361-Alexandrium_andersonii.AAC.1